MSLEKYIEESGNAFYLCSQCNRCLIASAKIKAVLHTESDFAVVNFNDANNLFLKVKSQRYDLTQIEKFKTDLFASDSGKYTKRSSTIIETHFHEDHALKHLSHRRIYCKGCELKVGFMLPNLELGPRCFINRTNLKKFVPGQGLKINY